MRPQRKKKKPTHCVQEITPLISRGGRSRRRGRKDKKKRDKFSESEEKKKKKRKRAVWR